MTGQNPRVFTPADYLAPIPTQTGATAGMNAIVPVVYGTDRREALIASVTDAGDKTIFVCVWSIGEIDAIQALTINDGEPPAGTVVRHYLGTASQGVDPGLAAAVSGYADTLRATIRGQTVALAYSVVEVADSVGYPRIAATIRGRKVLDPRTGLTAWSDNPSLCLADYLANPIYGTNRQALNVAAAADANDELVGGERRRTLGITVNVGGTPRLQWVETLRNYAGAFIVPEGAARKLVPNRPAAPVATITDAMVRPDSVKLSRPDLEEMPTVVRVEFTDTSGIPWRTHPGAVAYATGAQDGTLPWVETVYSLPGIQRGKQALREAAERLNDGILAGLDCEFDVFDEAIAYQAGDVVTLALREVQGIFRLLKVEAVDIARYRVLATQYVAAAYSDDTSFASLLQSPQAPRGDSIDGPVIGGVTSGGATYVQGGDGTVHGRIRVDLAVPPTGQDWAAYEVRFRRSGTSDPWQDGQVTGYTAYLFPVQEGLVYAYEVRSLNKYGVASGWVAGTHTVAPKDTPPAAPGSLNITVSSSGVRTITCTYPTPPLDYAGLRYQYSSGGSYVDLFGGLTDRTLVETNQIPAGNQTIRVRAQDRTGNASAWVYKTSNIAVGSDGIWYDVDQRITTEANRNNTQDGTLVTHDTTIGSQGSTLTTHAGQISTESTRNNTQDSTLVTHTSGINSATSTANSANSTAVTLRDVTVPPISSTANSANSTAVTLRDVTVPAVSNAANAAQTKANQAFDLASYGEITHDRIVTPTLAALTANLGTVNAGRMNFIGGGFIDLDQPSSMLMASASLNFTLWADGQVYATRLHSRGDITAIGNFSCNGISAGSLVCNGALTKGSFGALTCDSAAYFNAGIGLAGALNMSYFDQVQAGGQTITTFVNSLINAAFAARGL